MMFSARTAARIGWAILVVGVFAMIGDWSGLMGDALQGLCTHLMAFLGCLLAMHVTDEASE